MIIHTDHTIDEGITIMAKDDTRINIDALEGYGEPCKVWLNISVPRASCSAVLTKDQAKAIAATLTKFAEAA